MSALLGAGPAAAARFVQQAKSASIRLDLIWCLADQAGRYRMAVLAVPSPGRTAMLVASHARNSDDVANLGRAVSVAAEGCRADADLAQALVDPALPLDVASFEAGGLRRMATLDYLERGLPKKIGLSSEPVDLNQVATIAEFGVSFDVDVSTIDFRL